MMITDSPLTNSPSLYTLDCREQPCPMPILTLRRFLNVHPSPLRICLLLTDPGCIQDLPLICTLCNVTLESTTSHDTYTEALISSDLS